MVFLTFESSSGDLEVVHLSFLKSSEPTLRSALLSPVSSPLTGVKQPEISRALMDGQIVPLQPGRVGLSSPS